MVKLTSPAYQKAIQSLWDGSCTIIVRDMALTRPPAAQSRRSTWQRRTFPAAFPIRQ